VRAFRESNPYGVLQGEATFARFRRLVEAIPFSEREWDDAGDLLAHPDPVVGAAAFFVRCRQSLAGRRDTFAPITRTRTRRGMNEQASAWLSAVEGLLAAHARFARVAILCRPAVDVIRQQDGEATLFYLDPPYPHSTRATTAEYDPHEMSEEDHVELLEAIQGLKGKVMLSGYACPPYDDALKGWRRETFEGKSHAGKAKRKASREEVLWLNC
jgi:DNA adenine methylase